MVTVKDSLHVMVENTIALTASRDGKVVSPTLLANGEMCVCDTSGIILSVTSSTAAVEKVFVVQRQGTDLVWSPAIVGKNIVSYKAKDYSAPVEQVTYLGYNASTTVGSIDPISDNLYLVRLLMRDGLAQVGDKQYLRFGAYKSDLAATQQEVADGLYSNLLAGNKRQVDYKLLIEMVISDAGAALTAATGNWTFTKGSETVTYTGADPGANEVVAGNYLRVGTAVTSPVYKVSTIDTATNTVTLVEKFQGDTVTVVNGTTGLEYDAVPVNYGIRFTAVARKFQEGLFKYGKTRFSLTLQDFGTTQLATTTNANEGIGYGQWVAEQEWFAQGTEGKIERLGVPPPASRKLAVDASTYGLISIEWTDTSGGTAISSPGPARKRLLIACGETGGNTYGTDITDNTSGVIDVLDDYIVTSHLFGTAQAGILV